MAPPSSKDLKLRKSISTDIIKDWHEGLAQIFSTIETDSFTKRLNTELKKIFNFDLMNGFYYSPNGKAFDLHNLHTKQEHQIYVQNYLAGCYILDPFYNAILKNNNYRLLVMRKEAPDNFQKTEYYQRHYIKTAIVDEIGIVINFTKGCVGILSFSRLKPNSVFADDEIEILSTITPIISMFCQKHWFSWIQKKESETAQQAFSIHHPYLTQRETEIVALILKGFSSQSIASLLSISPNTIKVHRRQIYAKLKISSQIELFHLFFSKNLS